ncbi:MAG: DUF3108 domain-containing protein [Bacteroidetes bacterium]|nr:DUF3108 domain-containing protein [Bacteroidota bacterium]
MTKKIIKIFSMVAVGLVVSVLVLRSVYAVSLFHGLTNEMENSGWSRADSNSVVRTGEELTYEASYLFFKIGAVRFHVLGRTVYDSIPAYELRADIDSYSGIPFVDLHAIYITYADAKTLMCIYTSNSQKEGDGWLYTSCNLHYAKGKADWQQSKNGVVVKNVEYPLDRSYTDGLSFFYYLREASKVADGRKTKLTIPIVVDTVRSSVVLTINEKKEPCDIKAYDFPLESYRMSGHINFTGFFGVTGGFTGWMSADSAEVPLRGDVNVILGSVVVKLKDVKRDGWIPPRSKSK